ncbi:MAG: MATE family efflux transporter [Clostridia bacterium]|nr:MATE family efflux transporter [Clostridia bacterium]
MNDFSKGSIKKCIVSQAIPLTVAQLVHLLYNVVDRIYIGHLPEVGELALTGVGVTFPISMLIAAFTGLFGNGAIPIFSILRGKRQEDEAEHIMGNAFVLLLLASFVLTVFCYLFRRPILFLFGASEDSYRYANEYLEIFLLGTAFTMLATGMNGFVNAQGFPKVGMVTMILGAALNILLDPLFIYAFKMGVRGAAAATVISQAASAAWVVLFLFGKKPPLRLKKDRFRLKAEYVKEITAMGATSFVMQGSNCLVQVACNNMLQTFGGDLYVGIMTILNSVREVVMLPVSGISSGAQPVLGFNYGAGENGRFKEGVRFITLIEGVYTLLAWLLIMLIPRTMFRIFTVDAETITVGARMLNIYFFGFVFMTFQFSGQITFQALGRKKKAIFFSMLRKVIIVVPLTLLLPHLGLGVLGVFLAEPISNVVGGSLCYLTMYLTEYRKM